MVASTDIKFYVHTNNNAPQLQNAYGSMINVLDACLLSGIFIGTITFLRAAEGVATATFSSAHNLINFQVIKIDGAVQAEFNGEHRISAIVDANTIEFKIPTYFTLTATGNITASLPALGWEKPFSSSNANGGGRAAYTPSDPTLLNKAYLRVVDELDPLYSESYSKYAKVAIVESMLDINTLVGAQAPYDSSNPDKNWSASGNGTTVINGWARWYFSRSTAMSNTANQDQVARSANGAAKYIVIGCDSFFYILNAHHHLDENKLVYGFGHLESETRDVFLSATILDNSTVSSNIRPAYNTPLASTIATLSLIEMIKSQGGQSVRIGACSTISLPVSGSSAVVRSGVNDTYQNLVCSKVYCVDSQNNFRGSFPSLNYIYKKTPYQNLHPFFENDKFYIPVNIYTESNAGQVLMEIG